MLWDVLSQVDRAIVADSAFDEVDEYLVEAILDVAVVVKRLAAEGLQVVWHRERTQSGCASASLHVSAQR